MGTCHEEEVKCTSCGKLAWSEFMLPSVLGRTRTVHPEVVVVVVVAVKLSRKGSAV